MDSASVCAKACVTAPLDAERLSIQEHVIPKDGIVSGLLCG